ncbi:DNA-binding transcriptional LysR family regulator [Enterobacter sp. BIGb0383]|uniref:LysR family transcriptional regulator n=1 Tax=unclassified Enterobacter TaxID=2608935 RepID=UPI000F4881BF|nr:MULTISPECIES: LysR family transcriptional regulator [unclassified Enterobacter]ROP61764.1 DNA-binding transcriptional LysR family regulator [Enterobacter sp. BIGb0383]ROS11925.1 DNA-binding transcriptional LysR family regulator [Enterobacter sp. BIGb0359]
MDLKRIKYFCKVIEHGSISEAARQLNMAQPPLSKRIQELEDELGASLLVRSSNGVEITAAGNYFYHRTCQILNQLEDAARETVKIAQRENAFLRIGLTHLFQSYFQPIILELYKRNPGTELRITVSDSSNLESFLHDGLIDVAFIQKPRADDAFHCCEFSPVPTVAIISKKIMPALPTAPIDISQLTALPLILLRRYEGTGIYERLIDLLSEHGKYPNIIMHITQPKAIIDCLESGLEAASLLPASEVEAYHLQQCHVVELTPSPKLFFPAIVKMSTTPEISELTEILNSRERHAGV